MELVEAGYKMTEVGIIPSDWRINLLKNISTKVMVGIASAATHAYRNKGIILFRNQNIKPNYLDDSNVLHVTEEYELLYKGKRLKGGDLLTARTGYPGTSCVVPDKYKNSQSFTTLITRPIQKIVLSSYLSYYINSEKGNNFFERSKIGGGQKNVNAGILKLMPIPLPPTLTEQKAIATALSDVDDLISNLDKLIQKKKAIKQGAMQELLTPPDQGGKRLKGFSGEWLWRPLGEIAKIVMGQSPSSSYYNTEGNGLPLIQGNADIGNRRTIIRNYTSQTTKKGSNGDIIMSVRAPVGEVAKATFDCCLGRGVCSIFFPNEYIYQYLLKIEPDWSKYSTGSTFDSINSHQLSSILIYSPVDSEEQESIAMLLTDMDSEIQDLETKRNKYKEIKQGMMQELLTGKIRLKF